MHAACILLHLLISPFFNAAADDHCAAKRAATSAPASFSDASQPFRKGAVQ
jgi:hypothetical protein